MDAFGRAIIAPEERAKLVKPPPLGFTLVSAPSDTISSVEFCSSSSSDCCNDLLVSSWDATTKVYDVSSNTVKSSFTLDGAVLGSCYNSNNPLRAYCGGLDCHIQQLDLPTSTAASVGMHRLAVSCMAYNKMNNVLFAGSWDMSVSILDERSARICAFVNMYGKVFSLATSSNLLLVASSDKKLLIFDVRSMTHGPIEVRESPLKHQIRKVAFSPLGGGAESFTVGSIEGRLGIEYTSQAPAAQAKKYAFKCHRSDKHIFPVSSIAYHPTFGTFATGGWDGGVSFWDGENRKKLLQLQPYSAAIAGLSFNHDGSMLAIATSRQHFEVDVEGELAMDEPPRVYIRKIEEEEIRPRKKA